ncbi:unnamed protein product [Notodromas monacha]|uniref:Ribosome biogenesis regulatory protein n=1 Tax=Notodromas monacha TaxID=399045 RepID=A0A7R9GGD1_9CRUS|nr:unnamed protein product [Notodromas monacha]CAG0921588.1 unnamed protein product [Notodromas monacha]
MATVEELLLKATEKYPSTIVEKQLELSYDVGNLAAVDPNPIELKDFRQCVRFQICIVKSCGTSRSSVVDKTSRADPDVFLRNIARDNIQLLVNKIWEYPTETDENELVLLKLPEGTSIIPRFQPIPKPKAPTKWEKYAKEKGIQKRKKAKLVWDEELKKWLPRFGYKKVAADKEKNWVREIPVNVDPLQDQFSKAKENKKERIAKNELQRLRNIAKANKIDLPSVGVTPVPDLSSNERRDLSSKSIPVVRTANASVGVFTKDLPKEKKRKGGPGKKRKFEPMFLDSETEKKRCLDILEKVKNKKPVIDVNVAVNQEATAEHLQNAAEKRAGRRKKGSKKTSQGAPKHVNMKKAVLTAMSIVAAISRNGILRVSRPIPGVHALKGVLHPSCVGAKKFSTDSWIQWQSGVFRSLSESTLVTECQSALIGLHQVTGLPWWATIVVSTLAIRMVATFPLKVYQTRVLARYENLGPEIQSLSEELRKETAVAIKKFGWDKKHAFKVFNKSLMLISTRFSSQLKTQIYKLVVRDNCHPMKGTVLVWVQIPLWVSVSVAWRNLAFGMPVGSLEAKANMVSLSHGGAMWFPNLVDVDHSFFLPVAFGLINLIILEVETGGRKSVTPLQKLGKGVGRIMAIVMVPVAAMMPSCVTLYWATSSLAALMQNVVIKYPQVRRALGVPKTPSESETPFKDVWNGLMKPFNPQNLDRAKSGDAFDQDYVGVRCFRAAVRGHEVVAVELQTGTISQS